MGDEVAHIFCLEVGAEGVNSSVGVFGVGVLVAEVVPGQVEVHDRVVLAQPREEELATLGWDGACGVMVVMVTVTVVMVMMMAMMVMVTVMVIMVVLVLVVAILRVVVMMVVVTMMVMMG